MSDPACHQFADGYGNTAVSAAQLALPQRINERIRDHLGGSIWIVVVCAVSNYAEDADIKQGEIRSPRGGGRCLGVR
jgi:hypothetical protein